MSDETGSVTYQYDQLSRLQSETRQFSGTGAPSGNFTLNYEYSLAGAVKAITDPTGSRVDYGYDATARVLSVTGSGANSAPTYASAFGYRAWGGVKDFDLGSGVHQHLGFNGRLQNTSFVFSNVNILGTVGTMSWSYDYYADGTLLEVSDANDPRFDRFFNYDHEGRIANALTGSEARGGTTVDGPYRQSYAYDVWENTTSRNYRGGWSQNTQTETVSYANNRHESWGYDNAGNVTGTLDANFEYDAAGRQNSFVSRALVSNNQSMLEVAQTFDGNGAPARKTETTRTEDQTIHEATATTYYLRSTPLGGKVVAELDQVGYKRKGYIYAGGMQIAQQDIFNPGYGSQVTWETTSPATGSVYLSDSSHYVNRKELDPLGADVNTPSGPAPVEPPFYNPKFDQMPIQYEGGPSQESRDAMAWWEGQLAITDQAIRDRDDLAAAWQAGDRTTAQAIIGNQLAGVQRADGTSVFGKDAAEFLYGPDSGSSDEGTHDLGSAYHVKIFGGPGFFAGQAQKPQRPSAGGGRTSDGGANNPTDSLGVDGAFVDIRCRHLRELLNREAKYGTEDAAIRSSTVRGGNSLYGLNNGPGAMTVNGKPIDQDWLVTLKAVAHDQGLKAAAAAYTLGKAANWIGNQFPGGKEVSTPFTEIGERNAIALAGSPASFSRIFDRRFMSKVCPNY
jgi:YD repeat-containing protein